MSAYDVPMSACNAWLLLAVMVGAGLLGGLANNFLFKKDDPQGSYVGRSLLYGIIASFMVPLFLKTISSNLINKVSSLKKGEGIPSDLFVFGGICLLAAVYSKTFIQGIADKILKEAKDAKQQAEEAKHDVSQVRADVDLVVAKETEPEAEPTSDQTADRGTEVVLNDDEKKVLKEMAYGRFTLRTRTGIAMNIGIGKDEVNAILNGLLSQGLVAKKTTEGKVRWVITDAGRELIVWTGA